MKTNLFPDLRCQEIPADLTGCRLCVSQHFVITSFPNTVKRFEVNVSLLFFFYTFQNGSNVFGMLISTRNNSQLQSEKGLLEKILQIKKYITSTHLHVFKAFTMTPKTVLRCLLFPLIICQMFL